MSALQMSSSDLSHLATQKTLLSSVIWFLVQSSSLSGLTIMPNSKLNNLVNLH